MAPHTESTAHVKLVSLCTCTVAQIYMFSKFITMLALMRSFVCRAVDAGIITETSARQMDTTPKAFYDAAQKACKTAITDMTSAFPAVSAEGAPYLCLDLTLQHALLTQGLKIPDEHSITLVKQVEYRGDFFEAAWPLGAAINSLSAS